MKHLHLSQRTVRLTNLNTRVEKHGEDDVVRADLDFEMTARPEGR